MLDYLPTFSFSSEEASLCCRETGERENESARGMMGRENRGREAPAFSLFPSPARLVFFNYYYYNL